MSSYTFSENTVTAKIGEGIGPYQGWTYSNDLQVVITGLSAENAGKYTLSCPALSACTTITLTGSDATTEGAVAGVSNDDGVAFYFKIESNEQQNYTFTLTDYTDESNPVVKTYTATGKTLDSSSKTKCIGIKIAYTSFAAAAPATTGTTDGHDWVQLWAGGPKWATCNVGATSPEEYGDYFAWGETEPYSTSSKAYNWSNYKWCNGSSTTMTKYCNNSSYGTVDNKTTLEAADDAATANWGDGWRMPTQADFSNLLSKCNWNWTTQGGMSGYSVTGKETGYTDKSIFLPTAGYRDGTSLSVAGSSGCYWSSSLDTSDPDCAYRLGILSVGHNTSNSSRCYGFSVRPVSD